MTALPNERLRAALLERGITPADLAQAIQVDEKTVERWITQGRTPYRRHRYATAAQLGVDESYLWPDALTREQVAAASENEIVAIYPHRWTVPRDIWNRLFETAEREIGILVYSGLFLTEDPGILALLADKAGNGVQVRILLGDPDSPHVAQRGTDEGVNEAMKARIHNALQLVEPLREADSAEIRVHDTILYNSIFRADDQLLVNCHVYGVKAPNAPVLHLRKVAGGDLVTTYAESFERVWAGARPIG